MSNHAVSDLISRIKNGYLAKKTTISSPFSRLRGELLGILKKEGYIVSYNKLKCKNFEVFNIHLKYCGEGKSTINEIKSISKPGRRVYCGFNKIPFFKNGLGVVLVSTSSGIIPDYEARTKKLGGELLFKIF